MDGYDAACESLNFATSQEYIQRELVKPINVIRLTGGLREHLRFFHTVDPAITRKRDIAGHAREE